MSKKTNPTVIGAFVVGAVLLLAVGVAVFGGAELLAQRQSYVAYFTEDTKGLRVGSNVVMNGVQIGQVSKMALIIDQDDWESKTQVTIEIFPENYIATKDGRILGTGPASTVSHDELINVGGLRATLEAESFVTGQLLVDVAFRPDTAPVFRGGDDPPFPEIPTIPSKIQEILGKVKMWIAEVSEHFDAEEFATRVNSTLKGIDELVNSTDIRETLVGVNTLTNRQETQELTATLQNALREVESAASDAGSLMRNADSKLDTDIRPAIANLDAALNEAKEALAAAKVQLSGDSVQAYQLGQALREVEGAARSMREFLDYLEHNPEALLKGKK
jgi:paraquat-inducible protein B